MSRPLPERMSARVRLTTYAALGALWLSGCLWMVLKYFFSASTEFGPVPNPWQPLTLRLHGWIAVAAVFLLGWMGSDHVRQRWRQLRNRQSGLSMIGLAAVLTITGYALYYTTDSLHNVAAAIHEV